MKKTVNLSKLLTALLIGSFIIIITICSVSILYLYEILSARHQEQLNKAAMENAAVLINAQYQKSCDLTADCSMLQEIYTTPVQKDNLTLAEKKAMIQLHDKIQNNVNVSSVGKYVDKAIFFRKGSIMVQYHNESTWIYPNESDLFWNSDLCREAEALGSSLVTGLYPATKGNKLSFWCLYPIFAQNSSRKIGYMVCEYRTDLFLGELPETDNLLYVLTDQKGNWLYSSENLSALKESGILAHMQAGETDTFEDGGYSYSVSSMDVGKTGFRIYSVMRVDIPKQSRILLAGLLILVAVSGLILAVIAMRICIRNITEPIYLIRRRLDKIANNDYSFDETLTKLPMDFAQIGNEINRMTKCIQDLLDASVEEAIKRKDYEIAALQNQINPHFIYNTLDSIHWMATLQKNSGICAMTEALSTLLRNLAYSPNEKLTLREELKLLDSYITIQSIRYMDIFDFECLVPEELLDYKIVIFSIQPLVENAIFHGVEPSGHFCTVTLSARIQGNAMYIEVSDNGVGMNEEQVELLNNGGEIKGKGQIGARNVRDRLRLIYGEPYGLRYESTPGEGTRAILMIPLEK